MLLVRAQSALQTLRAWTPILLSLVLWAAGLFEISQLVRISNFHGSVGVNGEETLYFAMGRGLLNGLDFYIDLFETKPPMIFWLGALSLVTTGGNALYRAIHVLGLFAIPAALSLFTIHANRGYSWAARFILGGVAFLFGAAVASFAITRSLGYQPEGFGIVPASVAMLLFAWKPDPGRTTSWRIAAIGLCFCLSVLTKEPFALSIPAGFVLLAGSKQDGQVAMKAVVLGALLSLLLLVVTGVAYGYFTVYLPEMFLGRVTQNAIFHNYASDQILVVHSPLWVRGLNIVRLFQDMWSSPYRVVPAFPFLALSVGVLFLAHQASVGRDDRHLGWFALGVVTIVLVVLVAHLGFGLEQLLEFLQFKIPADPFFRRLCLLFVLAVTASIVLFGLLVRYSVGTALRVAATGVALYLAMLAGAVGGDFSPHHFLFAVPVYVACFASVVLRGSTRESQGFTITTLGVVAVLLVLNSLAIHRRYNWQELDAAKVSSMVAASIGMRPTAERLDALLTACGDARYFIIGDSISGLQAVTVHSPYQLFYGLLRAESQRTLYFKDAKPNAFFQAKFIRDFAEAPILVMDATSVNEFPYPDLRQRFVTTFSAAAPSCARPYLPIPGLSVYFRG